MVNNLSLHDLPGYLHQGWQCLSGTPAGNGAPWLPVSYVAVNLACNISTLMLLRNVGAVTTTIVASCCVPITILAFTLPLPYLVSPWGSGVWGFYIPITRVTGCGWRGRGSSQSGSAYALA